MNEDSIKEDKRKEIFQQQERLPEVPDTGQASGQKDLMVLIKQTPTLLLCVRVEADTGILENNLRLLETWKEIPLGASQFHTEINIYL